MILAPISLRLLEAVTVPVIVLDQNGQIVFWNRSQASVVDYSSDHATGRDVREFLTAESGLRLIKEMGALSAESAPVHLALDWITRAGEVTALALSVVGPCAAGEQALIVMTGEEPSTRKVSPAAIPASSVRCDEIVSQAIDAIIAMDAEQRILLFNRGAEQIFGWSAQEAIGQTIDFLVPPRLRERDPVAIDAFARDPANTRRLAEGRSTIVGLRKNGDEFPMETDLYKVDLGGTRLVAAILRDISARKRHESQQVFLAHVSQTLASSLEFEETLSMVAHLAVPFLADCCVVDLLEERGIRRLKVVHIDPSMAAVAAGLEAVQIRDSHAHPIWKMLEERRSVLLREIPARYLESAAQTPEHQRLIQALAPVSLISVPLVARHRVLGGLTFCSVHPARLYEEEDLRLAEEVARRAAFAIDNSQLYMMAQRAIRARDEILGVVAHDLRNPLNTIQLNSQVLLHRINNEQERTRLLIDSILRATSHASHLIQDLLDVARIEAGHLTVQRAPCHPRDLLDRALEMLRPGAEKALIDLTSTLEPGLPQIEADRERILQVFSNLIGNAIKFTSTGGRVGLRASRCGDDVCFSVTDTGPGIATDHLPHLFDRFWQARPADRRGAGLGLAIAKGIAEAHGGRIWAESKPGMGSTFYFTVPMHSSSAPPK
jgi:PAS domain S-box-containing protein